MPEESTGLPTWKRLIGDPRVLLGATVTVMLATIAFPAYKDRQQSTDPAADARASYFSFMQRIGPLEGLSSTTAGQPREAQSTEAASSRLERDLFAPAPRKRARAVKTSSKASKTVRAKQPSLPQLSAILIDGSLRRAMIGGQVVSEGDNVAGYCVAEIHRESVVLLRNGIVRRLRLGGKR
ncbi:MAG: hypothetical protein KAY24_11135 [Candidatus Eisenbacteria sp.]|nr:hypothetical protein [Candidatus Eisenbacteria bacterium]